MDQESNMRQTASVPKEAIIPGFSREVVPGKVAVVHEDCKLTDLTRYEAAPPRHMGAVRLYTLEELVNHIQHRPESKASVFVGQQHVRAVYNYGTTTEGPGWGDDVAEFPLVKTPDWQNWTGGNNRVMEQEQFLDFLEDNMQNVVVPDGVTLLELVANFRMQTKVTYQSCYRTSDGQQQLEYQEDNGKSEDMRLPTELLLHLPVIQGAESMTTYEMKARLRLRVDKETHRLTFKYILVRPDIPERNAIADIAKWLREQESITPHAVYAGEVLLRPLEVLQDRFC